MADNADGKIIIKAELKDAELVKGLRTVGEVAKTTMKATALAISGIAAGIAAGIGVVGKFVGTYANQADEIDKGSQRLGISKKAYQEWKYVIEQCGGSIDSLEMGMKTLNDVVIRAKNGEDSAIETMVKLQKASGKQIDLNADQETQLNQVVNALASVRDAQLRASLATDLLGRSANDLLPTLSKGTDGIERLRQRAHDLGLVMGDEAVDAGVAFGDALSDLQQAIKARFVPVLTSVAQGLTNAINFTNTFGNVSATLRSRVDALNSTMGQYKIVMDQLATSSDTLTVSQRNLLKAQADLLRSQAQAQMSEVAKAYDAYNKKIQDTAADYGMIHDRAEDYKAVLQAVNTGNRTYLDILLHTSKVNDKVNGETSERTRRLEELTKELDAGYISGGRLLELEKYYIDDTNTLNKIDSERAGVLATAKQSIIAIAQAYAAGLINIDGFKVANKALYDEIVKIAEGFKVEAGAAEDAGVAINSDAESTAAAAKATKDYKRAIAEQNVTMLESGKRYEEAYQARVKLIEQDRRAALEELATNNSLIASTEDVTKLTTEELVKRLSANQTIMQQMQDLNTYYLNQEVMARQTADKQIANSYIGATDKAKGAMEQLADEIDANAHDTIEKAKSIKDMWADCFHAMGEDCKIATESMFAGLTDVGTAIANGEDGWSAFGKAGLEALAKLLQSLGMELAVMAVSAYPNFAQMALAGAMSSVAMVSAGIVQGFADKFATGGIVQHKRGIPDTGDKQLIGVDAGELILNRAQQGVIASQLAGAGASSGTINLSFSFGAGYSSDEVTQRIYSSINQMQRRGILPAWSVR